MSRSRPEKVTQLPLLDVPKRKDNGGAALSKWMKYHQVATYRAKNWTLPDPVFAWFAKPKRDPQGRYFSEIVGEYSFEAAKRAGLVCQGETPMEACERLAKRNGLTFPDVPAGSQP